MSSLLVSTGSNGIARVILNRPDRHNAFDTGLICDLHDGFQILGANAEVRVIILTHTGANFCAGADLDGMKAAAAKSEIDNKTDALTMARMFATINACPKPVIGVVRGQALGGGVGLVACCDIVICAPDAKFCLSEVKLGLIPAVISPFVTAKIGMSNARRYMIGAERFGAEEARRIGLVHDVSDDLETSVNSLIETLLKNAPAAMADAKVLIADIAGQAIDDGLLDLCAHRIATRRASDEGREGISAFLEKRPPNWIKS